MSLPKPVGASVAPVASVAIDLTPRAPQKPNRLTLLYAVEGWGKTTMASQMNNPLFILAPKETGYDVLASAGRIKPSPALKVNDWMNALATLDALIADPRIKGFTVILDSITALEACAQEYVCTKEFSGNWGEKGFAAYGRGYKITSSEILKLIGRLERLKDNGNDVVVLGHAKVRAFKNPVGADYDRYTLSAHEETYAPIVKAANEVYFGTFVTVLADLDATATDKTKAIGRADRVLYTQRRDAYDAKSQLGLPEAISIPNDHTQTWAAVAKHIK